MVLEEVSPDFQRFRAAATGPILIRFGFNFLSHGPSHTLDFAGPRGQAVRSSGFGRLGCPYVLSWRSLRTCGFPSSGF